MSRIAIPIGVMEFEDGGDTIWFQSPFGGTVFRIKTMGKIITQKCTISPVSHGDLVVQGSIKLCIGPDEGN